MLLISFKNHIKPPRTYITLFSLLLQDFKCHKLILSANSIVFKTAFGGSFREAKLGPDEPIWLKNVDPEVLLCALR